jgi:hypothetical protein
MSIQTSRGLQPRLEKVSPQFHHRQSFVAQATVDARGACSVLRNVRDPAVEGDREGVVVETGGTAVEGRGPAAHPRHVSDRTSAIDLSFGGTCPDSRSVFGPKYLTTWAAKHDLYHGST